MKMRSTHVDLSLALVTAMAIANLGRPVVGQLATRANQIHVGPNTQVSKAYEKRPHAEVILAAAPNHRGRLLAGSMVIDAGIAPSVVAYVSMDGGTTWGLTLERKAKKGEGHYSDPAVAFDRDGAAYFADLLLPRSRLEISSSRDGGHTWAAPFEGQDLSDRPFLVLDCTNGRFRSRAYCINTLGGELTLFGSPDGAKTFDPPKSLICKGSAQGRTAGQGVVLSDGTLVLPYRVLTKATDMQMSLRLQKSNTGGESFLDEQFLRDYIAAPQFGIMPGLPILAVDPGSNGFKDRLYLVWSERTEVGLRVMLMLSVREQDNRREIRDS
jgi:hypothetical protein